MTDKVLVVVEIAGGSVSHITAGEFVEVRVVDWDNLAAAGITCPNCGEDRWNAFEPDVSTADDYFICDACGCDFELGEIWDGDDIVLLPSLAYLAKHRTWDQADGEDKENHDDSRSSPAQSLRTGPADERRGVRRLRSNLPGRGA